MINYAQHLISKKDIYEVSKTLRSRFITQGKKVFEFEKSLVKICNSKFAIAVNSATSALHLACLGLNIGDKDIVWTSPNSFVASSNCALLVGAKIDFVDIELKTFNICPIQLLKKLKIAKIKNKLPKAVVVVHFGGHPCELKEIYKLSKIYNFFIIEDASHALGARYKKNTIGDCQYSDATIFSFHAAKIITTGEGGAILCKSKKLFDKIRSLRTHGIVKNLSENGKIKRDWFYEQKYLGLNYRMNDIQASLGISQLKKLHSWIKKRNLIADIYKKKINNLDITFQENIEGITSSYHLFIILIKSKKISRNKVYKLLQKQKIFCNVHYIPIYRHPFYRKMGFTPKNFLNCEKYYQQTLTLPIYPSLKKKEQSKIINKLNSILK
ncbi:UDP-4-amino-4,6-dideoxy-N-acetyl-beta-L-altrosamine transaminase [Candidatus Pelagibacter sp.]|nr:UDP-4-amino-4,6-dideoxy-N-acetyl-beta-L-altrosamine transaminase [Candidatus Pelagibacter sp.]